MPRPLARNPATSNAPTLTEALNGDVATFIAHRSHHHAADLPDLVTRAARAVGTNAAIGVATRLPRQPPAGAVAFLDSTSHAAIRIADPEIFSLAGPNQAPNSVPSTKASQHSWTSTVPTQPDPAWVREVLDAQNAAGANVLLSASGWVGTAGLTALDDAIAFVTESRNQLGADDPMFVNLTLHATWLQNKRFRDYLLAEMVENPEKLWWIRVAWPRINPINYSQLRHLDVLDGYRNLAEVARTEGKIVFLPNSGLTGWVATALGASGFSTGMSGTERAYEDKPPQGGGTGNGRKRYFERTLLHTMLYADHRKLVGQPGHSACGCRYCRGLSSAVWVKQSEQLHYLLNVAELTAGLGRTRARRQANALALVQQARRFLAALPPTTALTGESSPAHLPTWQNLLT